MSDLLELFALRNSYLPITHTPLLTAGLNLLLKRFPLISAYTHLKCVLSTALLLTTTNINALWYILFKYFISLPQFTHFPFTLQFVNTNWKQLINKYPNTLTNTLSCTFFSLSLTNLNNSNYLIAIIYLTLANYYKFYVIFLILLITKYLIDFSNRKERNKHALFIILLYTCSVAFYLQSLTVISRLPYFDTDTEINRNLLKTSGIYNNTQLKTILDSRNFNKEFTNEFKQINLAGAVHESVLDRSEITLKSKLGYFSVLEIEEEVSEEESEDTFQARTNKNLLIKKLNKKQQLNTDPDTNETNETEINELTKKINFLEKLKFKKPGNSVKISKEPSLLKITKLHNYIYKNFYQKAYKELFIKNGDEIKISFGNKNLTVKNSEKRFSDVKFVENKTNKNCIFVVETLKTEEVKAMRTYFRLKNGGKYLAVTKSGDLKLSFYAKKENTIFCVEANEINDIFSHYQFEKKTVNYRELERSEKEKEFFYNIFFNQKVKKFISFQGYDFSLIFLNSCFLLRFFYLNLLRIRYGKGALNGRDCFYAFITSLFLLNLKDGKFFLLGLWVLKEMSLEEVICLSLFFVFSK